VRIHAKRWLRHPRSRHLWPCHHIFDFTPQAALWLKALAARQDTKVREEIEGVLLCALARGWWFFFTVSEDLLSDLQPETGGDEVFAEREKAIENAGARPMSHRENKFSIRRDFLTINFWFAIFTFLLTRLAAITIHGDWKRAPPVILAED
jgi:hypothetical protein